MTWGSGRVGITPDPTVGVGCLLEAAKSPAWATTYGGRVAGTGVGARAAAVIVVGVGTDGAVGLLVGTGDAWVGGTTMILCVGSDKYEAGVEPPHI